MTISLVAPSSDSFHLLLELISELFQYEALPLQAEQTQQAVFQLINNPELGQAWFLEAQTEQGPVILGHVIISFSFSLEYGGRIAMIDQIYLKPEWRNQGIGTQILPMVEACILKAGARALSLEVNIGNKSARRFYERHQFVPHRQFCVMVKTFPAEVQSLNIAS